MKKIALIYWPEAGNVEKVANIIYKKFDTDTIDKFPATDICITDLKSYDFFIAGCSTVGAEIWQEAKKIKFNEFFEKLNKVDFKNKTVALFGLGDQILYPYHFVDNLAILKDNFEKQGANIVGFWPIKGYEFTDSKAVINNQFIGLVLDEDRQAEQTEERIEKWIKTIKKEFGF